MVSNDTISIYDRQNSAARLQHGPDGAFSYRDDQAQALFRADPVRHTMKANFIWDLPDVKSSHSTPGAIGLLLNDWQLSGIWTATTSAPHQVGFSYQSGASNVNLTGSPDYAARVRGVGNPGSGCSNDVYRQFNTAAFQGAPVGSVGLQSGANYVKGCFQSVVRSLDRAEHPAGKWKEHPAARRDVQCAQCRDHHRVQHDNESREPE